MSNIQYVLFLPSHSPWCLTTPKVGVTLVAVGDVLIDGLSCKVGCTACAGAAS